MELKKIKGLSDKRIEELNKCGIKNAEELIMHFPKNYLDLTHVTPLKYCFEYEFAFTKARLVSTPKYFVSAKKLRCVKAMCEQEGELFEVVWFNQPYVLKKLVQGTEYLFYGRIKRKYGQTTMLNPTFEKAEKNDYLKGILPVYNLPQSFFQRTMQAVINDALYKVKPNSRIPDSLVKKYSLLPLQKAYEEVHNPTSFDQKDIASDRIAVEEYFLLISAFRFIKGDKQQVRLNKYSVSPKDLPEFASRFGFEFTKGQKLAVNDVFSDMTKPHVMNRLIQGDVGCGKTAVALCALFIALKSGYQAALLSPTEVLAEQNYRIAKHYLGEFPIAFLSGRLSVKEKNAIKHGIKSGEIKLVVGTHAILQKDVEFFNLSLCICDEQQRFGVSQRSSLLAKGSAPDLLVMSATPIPRTLSLIFYGDLDITTISDKPAARCEIGTNIVPSVKYGDMLKFISKEIANKHKVYFVAPKIDEDPEGEIMSVTELYGELSERLPQVKIRLLHGKMKDAEKNEIMEDFSHGDCMALVSTTVIEVGVDVSDATVMVIFNADRFGLSQLHQLRGRVGRGNLKSYCFLLSSTDNPESIQRLQTFTKTTDGFKISEADFKMRGSGDFLGTKQSGRSTSELGALKYAPDAIFLAKKIADECDMMHYFNDEIKKYALEKYDKLCEVSLN